MSKFVQETINGWISMIRIHEDGHGSNFVSFVPEENSEDDEIEDNLNALE